MIQPAGSPVPELVPKVCGGAVMRMQVTTEAFAVSRGGWDVITGDRR